MIKLGLAHASIVGRVLHFAECGGKRLAISQVGGHEISWHSFGAALESFSAHIRQRLKGRNNCRIVIIADLSINSVVAYLAIICSGHTAVPITPKTNPQILARLLANCKSNLILGVKGVDEALPDDMKSLFMSLDSLTRPITYDEANWPEIHGDHLFDIVYSSGTTGEPKGIEHTHSARDASLSAAEQVGFDESVCLLLSTGFASNTTLVNIIFGLAFGGHLVLLGEFDEEAFIQASHAYAATHTMLVPVQYARIVRHKKFEGTDLSSFRMKFSTSAAMSPKLKRTIVEKWPGGFVEVYGMTEGGPTCILPAHEFPDKLHTVGQPAIGCDIRIVADNDREQATGEVGEVVGKSGLDTEGYLNRKSSNDSLFWLSEDGDQFIRSGDLGRFDDDGFLEIVGRKKDVINSGGYNVYAKDIEEILDQHPHVQEAAVVGIPSEKWGETPVAFVVGTGIHQPTEDDLSQCVASRVNSYQRPSQIHIVTSLPRNEIGKILKQSLRDAYQASEKL